jgi:hypothetical protein
LAGVARARVAASATVASIVLDPYQSDDTGKRASDDRANCNPNDAQQIKIEIPKPPLITDICKIIGHRRGMVSMGYGMI